MEKEKGNIDCIKFEECSASICPLSQTVVENGIWYSDEDICNLRKFQSLNWIKKQKLIAKAKISSDKYFTVEMLGSIRQVRKGMEGIDPDQPIEKARLAEKKWIGAKGKRVIASEDKKSKQVVAKKKAKPKKIGKKRGRPRKS